jgi:hypothetical protein
MCRQFSTPGELAKILVVKKRIYAAGYTFLISPYWAILMQSSRLRRARSGATKRSRSERILFLTQHIRLIRTKVNQRPIQQLGES